MSDPGTRGNPAMEMLNFLGFPNPFWRWRSEQRLRGIRFKAEDGTVCAAQIHQNKESRAAQVGLGNSNGYTAVAASIEYVREHTITQITCTFTLQEQRLIASWDSKEEPLCSQPAVPS